MFIKRLHRIKTNIDIFRKENNTEREGLHQGSIKIRCWINTGQIDQKQI